MQINFLAAADGTPLTKQYTLKGDDYAIEPYPFVRNVKSFEYNLDTIEDLFTVLTEHSKLNHCLLKGPLDQKLEDESRAGHTNATDRSQFACLDLDFSTGFRDVEDFIKCVFPDWMDTSYIMQHSNSAGITGEKGLRCHLFFLTEAYQPAAMKQYLMNRNLEIRELRKMISLSANGMSLRYPLDLTTCQNDKIIYIARPTCTGFVDPLGDERMVLVKKEQDIAPGQVPFMNPQTISDGVDDLVAELRKDSGFKKKSAKYQSNNPLGILLNPDRATVTSAHSKPNGYTAVNLNGGNSSGYYYRTDNPEILENFKGEPPVHLKDIDPDYYTGIMVEKEEKCEVVPLVFRVQAEDAYYNILYDQKAKVIKGPIAQVSSKDKMVDFLAQYNKILPDPIEDFQLEFDPRTVEVYNERTKWVNSFEPTVFLRKLAGQEYTDTPHIPTTINRVLKSICVDDEFYEWFINWLAFIIQTRNKTGIAPVFSGVPGTGKGILHEKILEPILGFHHTPKMTTQQLGEKFNAYIETALVINWDEALVESSTDGLVDKIKHLITEHTTSVRGMRKDAKPVKNYANIFISTNHNNPMPLPKGDRRFAIAPAQTVPIEISDAEVAFIEDELPNFMGFIQAYQVDTIKATTLPKNQAREEMIESSKSTTDAYWDAIKEGNLDYFFGFRRAEAVTGLDHAYIGYEDILRKFAADANSGKPTFVNPDDARLLYSYIIAPQSSPAKFKRAASLHHLTDTRAKMGTKYIRGWNITWVANDTESVTELMDKSSVSRLKIINTE